MKRWMRCLCVLLFGWMYAVPYVSAQDDSPDYPSEEDSLVDVTPEDSADEQMGESPSGFLYTSEVADYLEGESQWRSLMYEPRTEMIPGSGMKKEEPKEEQRSVMDMGEFDIEWLIWLIVGVIVLIIVIALFVILTQTSVGNRKVKHQFVDEEFDSLHADEDLKRVLDDRNYNEAIRIVYLRTLVWLETRKMIKWEKSKTAIEYYYELTSQERKEPLRQLTQIFLEARYDDVVADEAMYEKASQCSERICTR